MKKYNDIKTWFLLLSILFYSITVFGSVTSVNELRSKGYSLIPAPQEISLKNKDIKVDETWRINTTISEENIAFKTFNKGAKEILGYNFSGENEGIGEIIFEIERGTIDSKMDQELAAQGYSLEISDRQIKVTGEDEVGLYYGIQSLLQLFRPARGGGFTLPEGTISDWPDMNIRSIHWDTKHHQDRIETLKRYLDEAAYYKINTILFEMEDKYEYPSHPVIGAPGAYTKAEMYELCSYALERYIQIVPVIQAPSHMSYVLKHDEFAHLKADGNNYQACLCDEDTYQLIFDMYQDMIDATPGMKYFYISTDELYYAGICDKCQKEYNDENRSQAWTDFTNRAAAWLNERGRRPIAYVMFPMLMKDIVQLPSYLITPIRDVESPEWIDLLKQTGIEHIAYSPLQGGEFLFPNYLRTRHNGVYVKGRLVDLVNTIPRTLENKAELIGTFAGAWDDAGLHNETFWFGWVTLSQYAWSIKSPGLDQNIADFFDSFYGYNSPDMLEAYQLLQEGARYYQSLWDEVPSKERSDGYGSSRGKGIGTDRPDLTLKMLPLPTQGNISYSPEFKSLYKANIDEAAELIFQNDKLIGLLQESLSKVSRNRYNIEVLLSIAYLERYTLNAVLNLAKTEDLLVDASKGGSNFSGVVSHLVEAHELVGKIQKEQAEMYSDLQRVWEKSRFPKDEDINGKKFVYVFDDVKDHFAARRRGLDYMIAPFQRMEMEKWQKELETIIVDFALAKNVSIKGFEKERLED